MMGKLQLSYLVCCLGFTPAWLLAQDPQGEKSQDPLIILKSVKPVQDSKNNKNWVLKVRGIAPKLPSGTKVEFLLTWRGQTLGKFPVKLSSSSFSEEFKVKNLPISADRYMFRTVVALDQQSSSVKKSMAKNTRSFPPDLNPWTDYHHDHEFRLGSPSEIAAEIQAIRSFFMDRVDKVGELDFLVTEARTRIEAEEDEEFTNKDGKFKEKKYRNWIKKQIVAPIREVQEQIDAAFKEKRYMAYRLQLMTLKEITNGIARRVVDNSLKIYEAKNVAVEDQDKKPKNLDLTTRTRRLPSERYLKRQFESLMDQLPSEEKEPSKKEDSR